MVVGIRQISNATSTVTVMGAPRPVARHTVEREGQQGRAHHQEDDGETRQQDVECDLVGRLLALGALHQADHPVEEPFAGSAVTRTTSQSDSTRVPPVTALRSPPDSRITGALSR